jgi:prolipoprotein diacylglyceryltransferase
MKEIIRGIQPPVWYSVLFALGFIISYQFVVYFFKKEGKDPQNVDTLTVYMVLATIVGARLGHLLFYEPERFLADPLMFFRTWEGGLASHGGAFGILIAMYLYRNYFVDADRFNPLKFKFRLKWIKKKREGQSYLWILDRIVIVTAMTAAFIRFGNFVNSEIVGLPTESDYGVVFGRVAEMQLEGSNLGIERAEASKGESTERPASGIVPVDLTITFENVRMTEQEARNKIETGVKSDLTQYSHINKHYQEQPGPISYDLKTVERKWVATVHTYGVARHPAQLYEAGTSIVLFLILLGIWMKYKENTPEGLLFGLFLVLLFGLRFFHETFKENQEAFEDGLPLNMGQILSIPLILTGLIMLARVAVKGKKGTE